LGAPGAGVTTLGKAIGQLTGYPVFDTDDYYWFTSDDLPYRRKRNPDHRRQLLKQDLDEAGNWVLSGALCGWGDVFIPEFDQVVYLWAPADIRLDRIRQRETERYGLARIGPGGALQVVFEKFMQWAASYDEPSGNLRSREMELNWLGNLECPVLKIEKPLSVDALLKVVAGSWG
jgi:adenylate kinase family enzyme